MATGIDPEVRYCSQCGQPAPLDQFARFGDALVCPNCKNSYVQKLREGVAPGLPTFHYAGFWIRFLALIIDSIILGVAGSAVQLLFFGGSMRSLTAISGAGPLPPDQALAAFGVLMGAFAVSAAVGTVIAACYEGFFVARVGATPGKMVLGLRVVRPNGGPVTLGRAIGRYFAKWLSSLTLCIGYLIAAFDGEKRAMHDMIVDTRVIKSERPPVEYVPPQA
jgi:uncharacterized RDD family membrane protein YckC